MSPAHLNGIMYLSIYHRISSDSDKIPRPCVSTSPPNESASKSEEGRKTEAKSIPDVKKADVSEEKNDAMPVPQVKVGNTILRTIANSTSSV